MYGAVLSVFVKTLLYEKETLVKFVFSFILVFMVAFGAQAGGYYSGTLVDEYDIDSGLYFKSVKNGKEEGGFLSSGKSDTISDINIFNPVTDQSILIFGDNKSRKITDFIYESAYQAETQSILFGKNDRHYNVKNNNNIKERKPKDRILIEVYKDEQKSSEIWAADKSGKDLTKIKSIGTGVSWHIDVKNSKIRFVSLTNNMVKIESLEY